MKSLSTRKSFKADQLSLIKETNMIIENMVTDKINIRSIYYQLVSKGAISFDNKEYEKLSSLITDARYHRLIDNRKIADYTRTKRGYTTFDSVEDALDNLRKTFKIDVWATQEPIEIWYEKQGIQGVIELATNKWRLPMLAVKGQPSTTIMLDEKFSEPKTILYLGDLDIAGVAIADRIKADMAIINPSITVIHLGITHEQGDSLGIPKLHHKPTTKPRVAQSYLERFGCDYGYEIDAMPLPMMTDLIDDTVKSIADIDELLSRFTLEESMRDEL